ncbi:MAG TPA: hypothetical protein PL110_05930 [Candidatus Eremiobacteraeota bacterium]|nr:MAG: hypothetical protein BWY64_01049 [bacterium ADurb.Bin363]HPZ07632.1 hypothetical protein [Candidatus Eremiobacteraeota bacterium]
MLGFTSLFTTISTGITTGIGMAQAIKSMGQPTYPAEFAQQPVEQMENPFMSCLFLNDEAIKEETDKLGAFDKDVKDKKISEAKEEAQQEIEDAKQDYYDSVLEKKLAKLDAEYQKELEKNELKAKQDADLKNFENNAKPGEEGYENKLKQAEYWHKKEAENKGIDSDTLKNLKFEYDKKKQEIKSKHKAWVEKKEKALKSKKSEKESDLKEAALQRREEFFDKFMDSMKDGFTPEANAKRMELVSNFQESEAKHMIEDARTLMKIDGLGFPANSKVQNVVKEQTHKIGNLYDSYTFPNGSSIPPDIKQAYEKVHNHQLSKNKQLENLSEEDRATLDEAMDKIKNLLGKNKGVNSDGILSDEEVQQLKDIMQAQQEDEGDQPRLSININLYKFDGTSFS